MMTDNNPKKSLGQHWLHDKAVLKSIVETADIKSGDVVLEIGPGLGTLTDELLLAGAKVTALEFDHELILGLERKYAAKPDVKIVEGDIRKFDYGQMPAGYKVVANIPYYLTSHLIRQLADSLNKPERAVLLVQKEVAERICAAPGQMSLLSVIAQAYFDCSLGVLVSAKLFTPPPKVDSQVVSLVQRPLQTGDRTTEKGFMRVVKAGFSERRKTLSNSLHGGLQIPKEQAIQILELAGIEPTRRAQTLSLHEWLKVYESAIGKL